MKHFLTILFLTTRLASADGLWQWGTNAPLWLVDSGLWPNQCENGVCGRPVEVDAIVTNVTSALTSPDAIKRYNAAWDIGSKLASYGCTNDLITDAYIWAAWQANEYIALGVVNDKERLKHLQQALPQSWPTYTNVVTVTLRVAYRPRALRP